jgi:hypothetical protein
MPETVNAKALLGWMTEDEALKFLKNCVFDSPLSDDDLRNLWIEYRDKVAALGSRNITPIQPYKLTLAEESTGKTHVNRFRKTGGVNVKRVVKVDPLKLAIHQLWVVTDRSKAYETACTDKNARLRLSLGIGLENRTPIGPAKRNGDWLIKDVPHGEFRPYAMSGADDFIVQEQARFISLTAFDSRILLWAGYHRTYALVSHTNPDDTVRLLVGTLVSDGEDFLGAASSLPAKRDIVRGCCPPLFGDFFGDSLCITVKYLKLRCELHWNIKTGEYRVPMIPV